MSPALERAALAPAEAAVAAAKERFSEAARAALAGRADAPALVDAALKGLAAARAELASAGPNPGGAPAGAISASAEALDEQWACTEAGTVSMGLRYGLARRARESVDAFRERVRVRMGLDDHKPKGNPR